jgi:hypothetical protein
MIRSSEFKRSQGKPPSAPTGLHHLRVMPVEGGVQVTHHASPRAEAHATHNFTELEPFMEHMDEHMGPHLDYAGDGGPAEAHSSKSTGGLEAE